VRRLRILATLTCTATVADAPTSSQKLRIGRPLLSLAERLRREMEGRPPMEIMDE